MSELTNTYYKIDDLLAYLNKLYNYPQPKNHFIMVQNELVDININLPFRITLEKHIERLNVSLELIDILNKKNNSISYVSYSNQEFLFLSINQFDEKISKCIGHLNNTLTEINKFNDKLIRSIIFDKEYATIYSSGNDLNDYKFEYNIQDIFLENERFIDALVRCSVDQLIIKDREKNNDILKKIDSIINNIDIGFTKDLINKKDDLNELINSLSEKKSFIENISSYENDFNSIILSYKETERKLLENSNTLSAALNKTNTALSEFKSKSEFINEKYSLIKKDEGDINIALESIAEIKKIGLESYEINNFMSNKKEEIKSIITDAQDTLNIVSGASIAEYITQQEEKENAAARAWLISTGIILSLSLILIIVSFVLLGFSWDSFILKALTLPILLSSLIFSMRQYIKRKNIVDSYAHKKTLALSLTGFKKQINNSSNNEKQVDYILKAIEIMTESPLNELDKNHIKNELEALEKIRESIIENVISTITPEKINKKES